MAQPTQVPSRYGWLAWLVILFALGAAYVLVSPAVKPGGFATKIPGGFYGNLTEAFSLGQTHLNIEADPRLKTLKNPWFGYQGVPRLHDATYFNGRYYLYFGPTSAVILGLPWYWLTRTYLSESAMTVVWGIIALLFTFLILKRARDFWFRRLPVSLALLGALACGTGNYLLPLMTSSAVYPVPIACAHACALIALYCLLRAQTGSSVLPCFALASLAWGAAVASRPTYLFGLPALLFLLWPACKAAPSNLNRAKLAIVATLPFGVIAALMALYNYVRFGSVTEFGWHYQFAAADQLHARVFDGHQFTANLHEYLFARPSYSFYFPFTLTGEGGWGALFVTPITVLGLSFTVLLLLWRWCNPAPWRPWLTAVCAVAGANLLAILCLSINAERYGIDALPLALLSGVIGAYAGLDRLESIGTTRAIARAVRGIFLMLVIVTTANGAIAALSRCQHAALISRLRTSALALTPPLERILGVQHGPLRIEVQFQNFQVGAIEPLLVTGLGRDILFIEYLSANEAMIGYRNSGSGGADGRRFVFQPGQPSVIEINAGSLYPSAEHPMFKGWDPAMIERALRYCEVQVDGQVVFRVGGNFFPSDPADRLVGANPRGWATTRRQFSGHILRVTQQTPASPPKTQWNARGPLRMQVRWPDFRAYTSEPLVSTGRPDSGDLFFVTLSNPGEIKLGHDHRGAGAVESAPLPITSGQTSELFIDAPVFDPAAEGTATEGPLVVSLDGRIVLEANRPFFPREGPPVIGFNFANATFANAVFRGTVTKETWTGGVSADSARGPLRITLRFPSSRTGTAEPIATLGRAGKADVFYVRYHPDRKISFGHDRWGVGSDESPPLPYDPDRLYVLELDCEPLRRQATAGLPRVLRDGAEIFVSKFACYPSEASTLEVGANSLGASSCGPKFTGKIFLQERQ